VNNFSIPGNSSGTSKLFDHNYNIWMHSILTIQLKNNCMKLSFQSYLLLELNPTVLSETLQSKRWTVSFILLTYYLYWLCCINKYLHFNAQLQSTHLVSKHTCNLHIFTHDCLFMHESNAYKSPEYTLQWKYCRLRKYGCKWYSFSQLQSFSMWRCVVS
jgi:hypothetical protein